ncbi:MAG TPA: HAD family hydrolase [Ornithinibacter sp.]|jgi:putative hydrolase of the HAD superfamily|uniref:HAD family hydrolase n=1 Tax=Ornithinibacter sp. TaxID=2862748 RepID=UPI001B5B834E|nr:HAD family hydrolase [Ornithinibacter sp.]MBP6523896.1 HAD family hydrolase [Dermatophilaceae bacterium]HQA13967.1 HAD family hydrolase [Ornithinibacter sp.]HQV82362.1 HAD family hydrolase [Ornithinibacter sp.]HQW72715.1 HAD family hydrolase [Ornithinibacter sp.]HQX86567.1 HAD family hydrolase [Ornithinibacter sp.]
MSHPVDAVVFDWGGTLTPWHEVDLPEQWRVFAREVHGIPVDSPDVSQADLDEAHRLADRILEVESAAWTRGRDEHTSAALADILEAAGIDAAHDRHHLALAAYRGFWEPHTHTDPQVRPLWEGLRARGIKVGVLSNTIWSREYHQGIFERDGVLDLVDADLYSSELDHVKPHPEAFRAICRELDVDPRRSVYVGDRIFEDVHGPQQVGMRAIWIPHSDIPANQRVEVTAVPDGRAHELLDVLALVDAWTAA